MTSSKGIDLSIAADTRAAMSAIQRGVIDPLEDVSDLFDSLGDDSAAGMRDVKRATDTAGDAVEDLGRESKDAGDKLERSMRDAQRRTDDAKDEIADLRNELNRAGRAAKAAGDDGRDGFGKIKEGAGEVASEIGQNAGQAVSAFRGDVEDLGQVGQDTLGGLAATLASTGPAGIAGAAVLAAGAAGLGLITAEIEKENERVQKLKEYFAEAWKEAAEGGQKYISQMSIIGEMQDIQFNNDREGERDKIKENAKAIGVDYVTALRAAAGDQQSLNLVLQRSTSLYQAQVDKTDAMSAADRRAYPAKFTQLQEEQDRVAKINDYWNTYGDTNAENQKRAQETSKITSDYLYEQATATGFLTGEVDDLGNKLYELPDGTQVVVDAKTKRASADVDAFEKNYKAKFRNISDYNLALIRDAGKVAVEIDKVGNKVVTLPNGKKIFIDAKTKKASEDVSRFKGDYDKKIDQMNGRSIVAKVRPDTTALDRKLSDLQRGISLPVKVYQRNKFTAVIQ